jgi:hypothetical protein
MVTFALTLLVLLSPGDEPMATSIASATRAANGAETLLELRFVAVPPDDDAVVALARESQAEAIALLTWSDASHLHAQLRVYEQATARWVARDLEFAAQDPADEKGRTIGFNLASMLPDKGAAVPRPPAASPPAEAPAQATAANTAAAASSASVQPKIAPASVWTVAIEAAAHGVFAIGGEGTSAGGALGAQYRLGEHFSLCAAAALRWGHIEELEARLVAIDFGPGLAWRSGDVSRWGLQLRLDAIARIESVRRDSEGSQPHESHGRVVPAVGVGAELTFALNPDVALLANTSMRAVLGETDLILRGSQVAAFAPVELGLGLGARAYF